MPIADPYRAALRDALVSAVETKLVRQRRRARTRRVALTMAAIVAIVATVVTVTLPDDRADASLEVAASDGLLVVRLIDFESRPDEIVGALRNAGINAEVEAVPVGPSNVGRFVGASATEDRAIKIVHDRRFSFASFSVPEGFQGLLRLSLGRRAEQGEQWRAASDATAEGELLACLRVRGLTPSEAARLVADVPASVSWVAIPDGVLEPGTELRPPYATWRVVDALAPSAGLVAMTLTADGQWPFLTDVPQVDPNCKGN